MNTLLGRILESDFETRLFESGATLMAAIAADEIDVVLLDIVLPQEDGITIAKTIRARSGVPIVLLSGLSSAETITTGLNIGADDYVTKPFQPEILIARLRNALRHAPPREITTGLPDLIHFANCTCDPWTRTLTAASGKTVSITERELQLLVLLCHNAPNAVARDTLSRAAAGHSWQPYERTLDVYISHLRAKLMQVGCKKSIIMSHRGVGYSLQTEAAAG